MRAHKPRFVMAMYYPAEVTEDMGPTSVIPRTQYWTVDRRGFNQNEERLDPAMTPPLDADGWRAANAEMGAHLSSDDLGVRDARLAAAVELMGPGVHERKCITVEPGTVAFVSHTPPTVTRSLTQFGATTLKTSVHATADPLRHLPQGLAQHPRRQL